MAKKRKKKAARDVVDAAPSPRAKDETDKLKKQLQLAHKLILDQERTIERLRSKGVSKTLGARRKGRGKRGWIETTWGDSHGMRCCEAALRACFHDFGVLDPSRVTGMGDHLDCDGFLSTHRAVGYTSNSPYSYDEDIEAANQHFDWLQEVAPRAEKDYLQGNHEYRVMTWVMDQTPNERDRERLRRQNCAEYVLSLEKRGVRYYCRSQRHGEAVNPGAVKIGKVLHVHGISHAKEAATVHVNEFGANVWFGHTHRMQVATRVFHGAGMVGAWNPGCLCDKAPMYMHGKPTHWSHGYGLRFVAADGDFLPLVVPIIDGVSLLGPMLDLIGFQP